MQVPNRPIGAYGYSVRNYAPASLYPQYQGSQCLSSTKPPSGKSFTIDALLAKPEDTSSDRTTPPQCGVKYQPAAQVVPLTGHMSLPMAPAPYVYSPNMLHSAVHTQPGYSVYCYPPFTYQSSCRGAFYAQGKLSYCLYLVELSAQDVSKCQKLQHKIAFDKVINRFIFILQLQCPKSMQACIRSKPKVGSRNGCAPASPASSCPGWRRSLHGSSTWSVRRGSSLPLLCS